MATWFVPNLGPSVYMSAVTEAWAERTGHKIERKEFSDLDAARLFAKNIFSRVEDEKGVAVPESHVPATVAPATQTP